MSTFKFGIGGIVKFKSGTRMKLPRFNFWWERFPDPRNVTIPWPTHAGYASTWAGRGDESTPTTVRFVTNLSSSGAGSFRQALIDHNADTGPSVILFNVSGICVLTSVLPATTRGELTVLGETAPYPGFIIVGDGWKGNAGSGSLIRHMTILPGRYDDFGGTDPDSRDAFNLNPSASDWVFMNNTIGMGTDGNFDFNISQTPQFRIDIIANNHMWCLGPAGHSEGNHSRCTNQGAKTDHIAWLGTYWASSLTRGPNIAGGALTALVNCLLFDFTAERALFWGGGSIGSGVPDVGGHLLLIGIPVHINGPTLGPWTNNDGHYWEVTNQDNDLTEQQVIDATGSIFYVRDSYNNWERQASRENYLYTKISSFHNFSGQTIDETLLVRNAGRRVNGVSSSLFSGSQGYEGGGRLIWDYDTGSILPANGVTEPARWTPLVLGDSSSADYLTPDTGERSFKAFPATVVEEWIVNHSGPRPQDRNLIQLRVFDNLADRWLMSSSGNVGQIWDPRQLLLPPGAINSESISLETQFGYTQSVVINEIVHASHSDYPSNPTDINPKDGWPEVYRYVMRNYTQVVEDINGWYQVIEHL